MEKRLKVNGGVKAPYVRLIDQNNEQVGIVERDVAMSRSREAGLDLVEVSPTADPPVCRIMDYGKFQYEQRKKARESRKKSQQHSATLKEIRLRPETEKHDLDIKVKHGREFLEKGHKVQFTMMFRGRQMLHQDLGRGTMKDICEQLEDIAKVERDPAMSHRRLTMMLVPLKK